MHKRPRGSSSGWTGRAGTCPAGERKLAALEREQTRGVDASQADIIALAAWAERRQRLTEHGQRLRARVQEIEPQRLDRTAERRL
jgi:hypothetical protein